MVEERKVDIDSEQMANPAEPVNGQDERAMPAVDSPARLCSGAVKERQPKVLLPFPIMFQKYGGESIGKLLLFSFKDDEDEEILNELSCFLTSKCHMEMINVFPGKTCLEYDDLIIDAKYRAVKSRGERIELTNYEFEILYLLAGHPGQVFSKEQIYTQVWKEPYYGAEDNVMSLIRRIRRKIEPEPSKPVYILTVWGTGYKFNNTLKTK